MAGQAHNRFAAALAQKGGFAGLDGNAVKQQAAQLFHDPAGGILHAHAAAAGDDHQITGVLRCF